MVNKIDRIVVMGRSLSGKDTISDYLVENYGFTKLSFATGIYEICHKYFGMKEKNRSLLQGVGEALRTVNKNVWIDYTFEHAKQFDKVVIADCRKESELIRAFELGYTPVRIVSEFDIRVQRAIERDGSYPNTKLWTHPVEIGTDMFEVITIENNTTTEEFYQKINKFMSGDWSQFEKKAYEGEYDS